MSRDDAPGFRGQRNLRISKEWSSDASGTRLEIAR